MKTQSLIMGLLLLAGTGRMLANPGSGTLNLVTGQNGINTLNVTVSATTSGFSASDSKTTTATGSINVSFDADPASGATTAMTITGGAFQLTDMQFRLRALGFIPVADVNTAGMGGTAITPPPVPAPVTPTADGGTFDANLHQIEINQGTITGEITVTNTPIDSSFAANPVIGTGAGNGTITMVPGASSPGQRAMQTTVQMPVDFTDNLDLGGTAVTIRVQGTIKATGAVILQQNVITPVSWKYSNALNANRIPDNLSNAVGMDPTETFLYNLNTSPAFGAGVNEPTTADGVSWATATTPTGTAAATAFGLQKVWIIADLGDTYDLSTIKIWNFQWQNTSTSDLANRGVSQFDILVRNTAADTSDGTTGGTPINTSNSTFGDTFADDPPFNPGTANGWQLALSNQALAQAPSSDTYAGQNFNLPGTTARFVAIRVDSYYGGTGVGLGKVRFIGTPDQTPPELVSTIPADNATNVPPNTNLVANFSEPVQAGTGNITIRRASDSSVVETFNLATSSRVSFPTAQQVLIDPTNPLADGEYFVRIGSNAIKDLAGNFYAGIVDPDTTTWSFTVDGTAPALTSLSPATPATADPGTRLLLSFSETVTTGSGSITIRKAGDNSLVETIDVTTPGAVVVNGRTVAVVRSVTLAPNTAYYINIPAGAFADLAGNPAAGITGTSAWTFTTSARVPILVENFNGSSNPLNGTSADTFAAAITTAGGSATWAAADDFLQNGVVNGVGQSAACLNLGNHINDAKGTAAGKFELAMTISETTGTWLSLGFAVENAPNTAKNFTNTGTGTATTTGLGTIIYRAQTGIASPNANGELDLFGGGGSANGVDGPDGNTGFRTLTVTLDLTPAGGYNGTSNFGTVTWTDSVLGGLGSHTYTTARNIGSILISQASGSKGTINALALYQIAPANTYANWINSFAFTGFASPDLGTTGDPDNDGVDNALENLFGTSPEVFSQGVTPVSASGGNLVFRHTLNATPASDLARAYEWSTDLVTWNADGASAGDTTVTFAEPVVITPGTPALVEVTASVTGTPVSKVFTRIKVTSP
jgi:hypothetical protein